jgi:hypothetical protein
MLLGEAAGMITVMASAMDDSEVIGVLELMVTGPVGISSVDIPTLHIYPNPARDHIRVFFPADCEVAGIYSSSGALLREIRVSQTEQQLDISDLAPGLYFVRAGAALGKFVK